MIGYVTLGTNDLARSTVFYDAIATELGTGRMMESEQFVAWGAPGGAAGIGLTKPFDGRPATVGNGVMVALAGKDKAQVDRPQAMAAEILIKDAKSQPESLAAAPDGTLIVGSASTPYVYKIKPGSMTPEVFIDASAEGPGTFFLGQLVDGDTVWSCILTPVANTTPAQRHSALIGSDLKTGKRTLR